MNTQLIDIENIKQNRFQPRGEDAGHVQEIALSIARHGLKQIPSGRPMEFNEGVELSFGNTRLAAFSLLASIEAGFEDGNPPELVEAAKQAIARGRTFRRMPVNLVEGMDDEALFQDAIVENIERKDLNHIEIARSMQFYIEHFHKNARETGELFHRSDSTVRGMVRLLDLPEIVQEKIASGEIGLNGARRLLTLQRVAPEKVIEVANKLNGAQSPETLIGSVLAESENAVVMWESWQNQETPLAGTDLWELALPASEFPNEHLEKLEAKVAAKALGIELDPESRERLNDVIIALEYNPNQDINALVASDMPEDVLEKLSIMIDPPACVDCAFYLRLDKRHYCALRACFNRKNKAWALQAAEAAAAETAIPLYDKETDGKEIQTVSGYFSGRADAVNKLRETYGEDVRLVAKPGTSSWSSTIRTDHVQAVVVGESAKKLKEKAKAKAEKEARSTSDGESWEARQAQYKLERKRMDAANQFVWSVATPAFSSVVAGLEQVAVLEALAEQMRWSTPPLDDEDDYYAGDSDFDEETDEALKEKQTPKAERIQIARLHIVYALLRNSYARDDIEGSETPVQAVAKHLQGVAKEWGVKLPADWLEKAAEMEFGVSAETVEETPDAA